MKNKTKKTPDKITILEQIKMMSRRTIILQKPKVVTNKKLYKRDLNKRWNYD